MAIISGNHLAKLFAAVFTNMNCQPLCQLIANRAAQSLSLLLCFLLRLMLAFVSSFLSIIHQLIIVAVWTMVVCFPCPVDHIPENMVLSFKRPIASSAPDRDRLLRCTVPAHILKSGLINNSSCLFFRQWKGSCDKPAQAVLPAYMSDLILCQPGQLADLVVSLPASSKSQYVFFIQSLTSQFNMPILFAPPALRPVLLSVARFTQRHQVRAVQCDHRIVQVVRRQVNLVMHMDRRLDQALRQAKLTESVVLLQRSSTGFSPGCCSVESFDCFIVMHSQDPPRLHRSATHQLRGVAQLTP